MGRFPEHEMIMLPTAEYNQELSYEQIIELGNPEIVLDNLGTVKHPEFNQQPIHEWYMDVLSAMSSNLVRTGKSRYEDVPHIILLVGEPGTGKTTTASGLASRFMKGRNWDDQYSLRKLFQVGSGGNSRPRPIRHHWAEWGHAFPMMERSNPNKSIRLPETVRYLDPTLSEREQEYLFEQKRQEIQVASKILELTLVELIEKYFYREQIESSKGGDIIYMDWPGPRMFDDGLQLLHDLYHSAGAFKGLPYELHIAGIAASSDLLTQNRGKRPLTRELSDQADPLNNETMAAESEVAKEDERLWYIEGSATQTEIEMFNLEQLYSFRNALAEEGLNSTEIQKQIAIYNNPAYADIRQRDMATLLLPNLFRKIDADTSEIPIFWNWRKVPYRHSTVINRRPMEDLVQLGTYRAIPELQGD
ncbi:MAG: hypothetical protein ACOCXQ_01025 [Patescibacteria group bacterium]